MPHRATIRRPAFDLTLGDTATLDTQPRALQLARDRAAGRGCRQVVTLDPGLNDAPSAAMVRHGWRFWVIQDVR